MRALSRPVTDSSARLAANLFADTPFSGQVNLLTTGSFDSPQQLFSADSFARNIAYVSRRRAGRRRMPTGRCAARSRRAISRRGSWPARYTTRAPARHHYDIGLSYSTQRYDGATSPRCATSPTAAATPARSTRSTPSRLSPGAVAHLRRPLRALRLPRRAAVSSARASSRPSHAGRALPRSARLRLEPCAGARRRRIPAADGHGHLAAAAADLLVARRRPAASSAERTDHAEVEVGTRSCAAADGLAARVPPARRRPAGHDVRRQHASARPPPARPLFRRQRRRRRCDGWSAEFRTAIAGRVSRLDRVLADRAPTGVRRRRRRTCCCVAPSAVRPRRPIASTISATSIETEVPETATRVLVLYRLSNGFARPATSPRATGRRSTPGSTSRCTSRCRS